VFRAAFNTPMEATLGRRRESHISDSGIVGAGRHLSSQQIFRTNLTAICKFVQFLSGKNLLELRGMTARYVLPFNGFMKSLPS
jgi:hypothetical protein